MLRTLCVYEQATGLFFFDLPRFEPTLSWIGYAGSGPGRNNPKAQHIRNVGPLPCGLYDIKGPFHHDRLGPVAFRLEPRAANEMYGRSGFFIHGDNATNDASEGCIILPRQARDKLATECELDGCGVLLVVDRVPQSFAMRVQRLRIAA